MCIRDRYITVCSTWRNALEISSTLMVKWWASTMVYRLLVMVASTYFVWYTGHHMYTIGQGARLGGKKSKLFVSDKDPAGNVVTVVEGSDHPALYSHSFSTTVPHWICQDPFTDSHDPAERSCDSHLTTVKCMMRYCHLQPLRVCTVQQMKE